MVKFFIDECLSPVLVKAYHLVHIGGGSWEDWRVAAYALNRDAVLATNNRTDFQAISERQEVHWGLGAPSKRPKAL
jgi:hypothetical protein